MIRSRTGSPASAPYDNDGSGSLTIGAGYHGAKIYLTNASLFYIDLDRTAPRGVEVMTYPMSGDIAGRPAAGAPAISNPLGHTGAKGGSGAALWEVVGNSDGNSAVWRLAGDYTQ